MLSPIQKACVLWISQGKSLPDIELLTGRCTAEIETHLFAASASLAAVLPANAVEETKLSQDISKSKGRIGPKTPNSIDAKVGALIRYQRRAVGLSQEKLAEALGITFQQVQKYENGSSRVGAGRLYKIANVLRVPVAYFFDPDSIQPSASETHSDLVAGHDVTAFLRSAEGMEINAAFSKVKSPAVRRRVIILVKAIASSFSDDTSEGK